MRNGERRITPEEAGKKILEWARFLINPTGATPMFVETANGSIMIEKLSVLPGEIERSQEFRILLEDCNTCFVFGFQSGRTRR